MTDRPAVEPHRLAVGNTTSPSIASRTGLRPERGRRVEHRPPRCVGYAQIDGVAPDELMELVAPERVAGAEHMLRALIDLARWIVERRPQLDHERLGDGRRGPQFADDLLR